MNDIQKLYGQVSDIAVEYAERVSAELFPDGDAPVELYSALFQTSIHTMLIHFKLQTPYTEGEIHAFNSVIDSYYSKWMDC